MPGDSPYKYRRSRSGLYVAEAEIAKPPFPRGYRFFMPPFGAPFQAPMATPGGAAIPWYLAGGVALADCVAAYQPKGAASLAASYVNLAHPGTNDAAPGTAPAWDATNGWKFTATSSHFLNTGIAPANWNYTYIVRFSNATNANGYLIGSRNVANTRYVGLVPRFDALGGRTYLNGNYVVAGADIASGVMALSGLQPYLNGATDGSAIASSSTDTMPDLYIGARDEGIASWFYTGYIQAVAIYSVVAPQVAAISAAMAAL